jgi:hypothetical protein
VSIVTVNALFCPASPSVKEARFALGNVEWVGYPGGYPARECGGFDECGSGQFGAGAQVFYRDVGPRTERYRRGSV